jgi:excisionase family DNA binding protein
MGCPPNLGVAPESGARQRKALGHPSCLTIDSSCGHSLRMEDASQIYSMEQAATALGLSRWTLRDRVTKGEVPHHRSGRLKGVFFTQEDLDKILAGQARQATSRGARGRATDLGPAITAAEIPAEFAVLRRGASS